MSTINFDQFFQSLETGVESLSKSTLKDFVTQAKNEGKNVVDGMKVELQQWTREVADGSLTMDDLKFLIKEETALAEMSSLKEAGLAEVRIDEFKDGLINIVTGAVAGLVKI